MKRNLKGRAKNTKGINLIIQFGKRLNKRTEYHQHSVRSVVSFFTSQDRCRDLLHTSYPPYSIKSTHPSTCFTIDETGKMIPLRSSNISF